MSRRCIVVNALDTQSDNLGSILGRSSLVNQAIYPSGVGKLVAISNQWGTAGEYCKLNSGSCDALAMCPGLLRVASHWPSASKKEMGTSRCSLRCGTDFDFFKISLNMYLIQPFSLYEVLGKWILSF